MKKIKLRHCEDTLHSSLRANEVSEAIPFLRLLRQSLRSFLAMTRGACALLAMTMFIISPARAEVISSLWRTEKSQHFIVYYQEANPAFVSELINQAEDYYNGIMEELGYRRFDFWSWENRAKIYLYNNADDFHKQTQREDWTGAIVSVPNRTIQSYVGQSGFFDSLLPHEMTHIIFREFIGKHIALPLWIDEGVASSQEKSSLATRMHIAKELVTQGQYLPLSELSGVSKLDDKITPRIFYSEAAALIVFLIREDGKSGFLDFSRALRDGTDWKKALFKTYNFSTLEEMEEKWKKFILKESFVR